MCLLPSNYNASHAMTTQIRSEIACHVSVPGGSAWFGVVLRATAGSVPQGAMRTARPNTINKKWLHQTLQISLDPVVSQRVDIFEGNSTSFKKRPSCTQARGCHGQIIDQGDTHATNTAAPSPPLRNKGVHFSLFILQNIDCMTIG